MAVTTAVCNSYKLEVLRGIHLDTDTYKLALLKAGPAAAFGKGTTNYSNLGADELTAVGYIAGGLTLANGVWTLDAETDTASIDWDPPQWTPVSFSSDGALIYNATRDNRAVQVISFADTGPSPVVSTNGPFTVLIPSSGVGQVRFT